MIRSDASGLIGLIEMPGARRDLLRLHPVQHRDHLGGFGAARLVLDARVQILGVLANDDEVDVVVA